MDNLERCLSRELNFNVDAFFFTGKRAMQEAWVILNASGLNQNFVNLINEKIDTWSPVEK